MKSNGIFQTNMQIFFFFLLIVACSLNCSDSENDDSTDSREEPVSMKLPGELRFKYPSFTFVRVRYSGNEIAPSSWMTDYPESDLNFTARFQEITGLETEQKPKVMELTDPDLKDYPFIYIVEGGGLLLSEDEVTSLRNYLLGGGFLMVDDFWGEDEWKSLYSQIKRVFPEREPIELLIEHDIFNCFYKISERPQVPSINVALTGTTSERGSDSPRAIFYGIYDDKGRMMVIICRDTDLGDGWEREAENEWYFHEFSEKKAYPLGINIVVYALTH